MSVCTLGINHKTAPIHIRERVAFTAISLERALHSLKSEGLAKEAVIVSTCNRTEIYTVHGKLHDLLPWWSECSGVPLSELETWVYQHEQADAVRHLMRVSCGLDSMVLGEPEILGQLKDAYELAFAQGVVGKFLARLFQQTFSVAKKVRSQTGISHQPVSVAFLSVSLAKQIFSDMSKVRVLLLGAGQTMELAARHLQAAGVASLVVANRTIPRAQELAERFNGRAISLEAIPTELGTADIVISATGSPHTLVGREAVNSAMQQRRYRPLFLVDLAVPRDIAEEVKGLDNVYLYTVDDLEGIVQKNHAKRQKAARQAEGILQEYVADYLSWQSAHQRLQMVRDFQSKVLSDREDIVHRYQEKLRSGRDPHQVVEELSQALTKQWLHETTLCLRDAIYEDDECMVKAFDRLITANVDNET